MTKIVNKDQPMTLFGEKTPRAVIYKSESHKLHQAFCEIGRASCRERV